MTLMPPSLVYPTPALLPPVSDVPSAEVIPGMGVRVGVGLADVAATLAIIYAFPFVILAVGTPLAVVIVSLLWAGRVLQSAF